MSYSHPVLKNYRDASRNCCGSTLRSGFRRIEIWPDDRNQILQYLRVTSRDARKGEDEEAVFSKIGRQVCGWSWRSTQ